MKMFWIIEMILQLIGSYQDVSAPELFGDGHSLSVPIFAETIGIIHAWGIWAYIEHPTDAGRSQTFMLPLSTTLVDPQIVYGEKFYNKLHKQFKGFIYFRGHERKFCGGNTMPASCLFTGAQ